MIRKTFSLIVVLGWLAFPALAEAAKTTYIYTNRKYHFIKRVELKKKELKERGEADHPHSFDPSSLRELLTGIEVSRQMVLSKEADESSVFDKQALDFTVPHLVEAFKQAQPNEQIVFSFIVHKSRAIFQDNRLTLAEAWVKEGFLHISFRKLMAKIDTTNYDKFADVSKAINRARGLRVSLELKEGQQFGESTDEILLPLAGLPKPAAPETEEVAAPEPGVPTRKVAAPEPQAPAEAEPAVKEAAKPETAAEAEAPSEIEARLRELEDLKTKKLITKKEYETKKKEILNDL